MKLFHSAREFIGGTPLLELHGIEKKYDLKARLFAKVEFLNPAGSAKDRVALSILEDAEKSGRLQKGGTVIEPTSGNTGIALAALCAAKGYLAVIIMPDTMSEERRKLVKIYGAELILTDGKLGMKGAADKAEELLKATPNSIIAGQFDNPANPAAHYRTTGPEIFEALDGHLDMFIAGMGTGGTVCGTGRYLKERIDHIEIVAAEPAESPLLTKGIAGPHGIQGIGANFVPGNYDKSVVDRVVTVATKEAKDTQLMLARTEGLFCGISSGCALFAGIREAEKPENEGKSIAVLLPDGGERYLSGTEI